MRAWIVAGLICGLYGCSGKDKTPSESAATPSELTAKSAEPPPPAAPEPPPPPITVAAVLPDAIGYPKAGWTKVKLEDELPICVFESEIQRNDAGFIEKVKKKPKLKADAPLVFGTFAAGCINDACDDLPMLQCWVDRETANTLVLHSRYSAYHKDGSQCGQPCRAVDAGCQTDPLPAGTYTVKHGTKTTQLKVPGTLKSACLK